MRVHVPYRGGALAVADLLGGRAQAYFSTLATSIEYIRAAKLRALAVTAASRVAALPDIPTVGDFVPDYETSIWGVRCTEENTRRDHRQAQH